jgi:hypothetical protein
MWGKMTIRFIAAAIILTGIIGYTAFESRHLFKGPVVVIETPSTGSVSNSPVTNIRGHVGNIVRLSMNGRDIPINEAREFTESYALSDGVNVVKVIAENRFGEKTEKIIEILYNEPALPLVQNTLPAQN